MRCATFLNAAMRGVILRLSAASTSAPACTSSWTTSRCPPFAASHSGVFPFLLRTSIWAPLETNDRQHFLTRDGMIGTAVEKKKLLWKFKEENKYSRMNAFFKNCITENFYQISITIKLNIYIFNICFPYLQMTVTLNSNSDILYPRGGKGFSVQFRLRIKY